MTKTIKKDKITVFMVYLATGTILGYILFVLYFALLRSASLIDFLKFLSDNVSAMLCIVLTGLSMFMIKNSKKNKKLELVNYWLNNLLIVGLAVLLNWAIYSNIML